MKGRGVLTFYQINEDTSAYNVPQNTKPFVSSSLEGSLSQPMGIRIVAGFMVPWEPLFVKCHGGSPDTGTGEDEFSFRAVSLLTPLILRVLMMNFFLFLFLFISL